MGRCGVELWGGIECTVNRVQDRFSDQVLRTGHHERDGDVELLSALGIRAVRYPVLWERIAANGIEHADWSWTDRRLEALRRAGIDVIATLVHHGSGPSTLSFVDGRWPAELARFARAVAQRYPWLKYYTPVNEPLTTARFSCLYGHWYPHMRDNAAFARALVVQVQGVARAMEAIREVNPDAILVQTEDLGKTYATPELQYQADWENERRWATYDLLCGNTTPFTRWLRRNGIRSGELRACRHPIGIAGFNYYITSERFLDHRLERYPAIVSGGNGYHRYVDVEACRACEPGAAGLAALLEEAWVRFRLPLAVTEAHLGCTREQQLRWLEEGYDSVNMLCERGIDVRAYTPWALFGMVDWCSLLTRDEDIYEAGAFDVRTNPPKLTAIGAWITARSRGEAFDFPALEGPGWWRVPQRLEHPLTNRSGAENGVPWTPYSGRGIAIVGRGGGVNALRQECAQRGLQLCGDSSRAWLTIDATTLVRPSAAARFLDDAIDAAATAYTAKPSEVAS